MTVSPSDRGLNEKQLTTPDSSVYIIRPDFRFSLSFKTEKYTR